jgi:hypothetical protein
MVDGSLDADFGTVGHARHQSAGGRIIQRSERLRVPLPWLRHRALLSQVSDWRPGTNGHGPSTLACTLSGRWRLGSAAIPGSVRHASRCRCGSFTRPVACVATIGPYKPRVRWQNSSSVNSAPDGFIEPCLPTVAPWPPSGDLWLHEIKHDGYRTTAGRFSFPRLVLIILTDPAGIVTTSP